MEKGYTLIELLLYIAITGILLGALVLFFAMATNAHVKNQTVLEVERQGQQVIETISQSARSADTVTAPTLGGTTNSLTLVTTSTGSSPTIFTLSGSTITMQEGSGQAVTLTNSKVTVSNFTVKNVGKTGTAGSLQVSVTLNRVNASAGNSYDYQKTFVTTASLR